jgi:hypothetical protein
MPTAILTVESGSVECTVRVEFSVLPGEPMVRYYADGSGYPGSPDQVDLVDHVELIEYEYPIDGDHCNLDPNNWVYVNREAFADHADQFALIELDVINKVYGGDYDDELLDNAGDADRSYYAGEDDYV